MSQESVEGPCSASRSGRTARAYILSTTATIRWICCISASRLAAIEQDRRQATPTSRVANQNTVNPKPRTQPSCESMRGMVIQLKELVPLLLRVTFPIKRWFQSEYLHAVELLFQDAICLGVDFLLVSGGQLALMLHLRGASLGVS